MSHFKTNCNGSKSDEPAEGIQRLKPWSSWRLAASSVAGPARAAPPMAALRGRGPAGTRAAARLWRLSSPAALVHALQPGSAGASRSARCRASMPSMVSSALGRAGPQWASRCARVQSVNVWLLGLVFDGRAAR